jgi:hypothetical protein
VRQDELLIKEAKVGKPEEPYILIVVETYFESGGGLHGDRTLDQSLANPCHEGYACAFPNHCGELIRLAHVFLSMPNLPTKKVETISCIQIMHGTFRCLGRRRLGMI